MIEIAQLTAAEIACRDVMNHSDIEAVIQQIRSIKMTRILVTDQTGHIIYDTKDEYTAEDSQSAQIHEALKGTAVSTSRYFKGVMQSEVATSIVSSGTTVGCIYILENDPEQGAVIHSLQMTVLATTVVMELIVVLYSVIFSCAFSWRMRKIMHSMRIIQDGDFSHRVTMMGNDELAFLAKEFNDLTSRLQISEDKRRQFVSDASHEIKTPLASIKLLSDSILQNEMDIETVREFVGDIGEEADRLNAMTQKLLDLTRGEHSGEDEIKEIIYMAPTVNKVVHRLSPLAETRGVTIHTDLRKDAAILVPEDDLYRIIYNLAENGIKYNTPNGTLRITLMSNEENGILCVEDTGVGIPNEAMHKIFERFFRVDKARSRATGGSGLGLSIVKSMVNRNDGKITVKSQVEIGSTFTVEFPVFYIEEETVP